MLLLSFGLSFPWPPLQMSPFRNSAAFHIQGHALLNQLTGDAAFCVFDTHARVEPLVHVSSIHRDKQRLPSGFHNQS